MTKKKQSKNLQPNKPVELRIIGGRYRGSKLVHELTEQKGKRVVRPMKHRTREAIFNLIGTDAKGRHAIDMFAGTGALGLEAISRGAESVLFIEKHVPSARVVEHNIQLLGMEDVAQIVITSAFLWGARDLPAADPSAPAQQRPGHNPLAVPRADVPWVVFCCPPYEFFISKEESMLALIDSVLQAAPVGSMLIVEADDRFDYELLKNIHTDSTWDVRTYFPAVVGVYRKRAE